MAEAIAPRARSARERRVRLWCVLALALLLPAAYAANTWRQWLEIGAGRETRITRLVPGESADYAGAQLRLEAFRVIKDDPDPRIDMAADRALVVVRLGATTRQDIHERWNGCRLSLVDAEGRRWSPISVSLPRAIAALVEPDDRATQSCGGAYLARPAPGAELLIGEKFLVPRDALPTLEARFSTRADRPDALAFSQR